MSQDKMRILFVDDDERVLVTFWRSLSSRYEVVTAVGPREGLNRLRSEEPFAVVVSDLKMPEMSGVEFLAQVRKRCPETVRVMLTGYADLESAIASVNENQVFRFLTKPCDNHLLIQTLEASVEQYRLVTAEKELLQGTLRGSIKMLTDVLALLKPDVYGRLERLVSYARKMALDMQDPTPWQIETAARLALLGYIALPDAIIKRLNSGRPLSPEEAEVYGRHPVIASSLVSNIPRMGALARIITYQDKHFDGSGLPADAIRKADIPLGSRIIKVAKDFDILVANSSASKLEALAAMRRRVGVYDPDVLSSLERVLGDEAKYKILTISVSDLRDRMIIMEDIHLSRAGKRIKVLSRGQEVNAMTKEYLRKYFDQGYIGKSVQVIMPLAAEDGPAQRAPAG